MTVRARVWRGLLAFWRFCGELLSQKHGVVESIGDGFAWWGGLCFRHPLKIICGSIVACLILSTGLLPPTPIWIDGAERLYTLPFSRARDDGVLHENLFGDVHGRKSVVILTHKVKGTNILTWQHLEEVRRIDSIIQGKDTDPEMGRKLVIPRSPDVISKVTKNSQEGSEPLAPGQHSVTDESAFLTFEDVCLRNALGGCSAESVLSFGLADYKAAGLVQGEPEVWLFGGTAFNVQQVAFIPEYYLGGFTKEACERRMPRAVAERLLPPSAIRELPTPEDAFVLGSIECITSASALMLHYDADGRPMHEERNATWERLLIQVLKANQTLGSLRAYFQAFRSRDDELKASTAESKDVVYVVFTFFLLASYSTALNFSCDLYRSKLFSSLMGFLAAFMGLGAGMGIVCYMKVAMVPTVLICPFLVLGIGVDDVFVLLNAYCMGYTTHDPEQRCIDTLKTSGLGITITTLTNLISFGVGSFSTYLSIRNFCVYSAMALLLGYIFVLTFFFPVLCLDAKREFYFRISPFCLPTTSQLHRKLEEEKEHMGPAELQVHNVLKSVSQEEIVAYRVNVFFEEQELRKRMRREERERRKLERQNAEEPASRKSVLARAVASAKMYLKDAASQHLGVKYQGEEVVLKTTVRGLNPQLARHALYDEPRGSVGRRWRTFFLCYYGPFLMKKPVKIAVLVVFLTIAAVSIFGFSKLELGLEISELAPVTSYMRRFDEVYAEYFNKFDQPTDIFFLPTPAPEQNQEERTTDVDLLNPDEFLGKAYGSETQDQKNQQLQTPQWWKPEIFLDTLYYQLMQAGSPYRQFALDFVWSGSELKTYRMRLLPKYMARSEQRAFWMQQLRQDCDAMIDPQTQLNNMLREVEEQELSDDPDVLYEQLQMQRDLEMLKDVPIAPLKIASYTYMMVFYESDLGILSSVLINMLSAGVAMLLVAFILIPELSAGLLVIMMICLIDLALFGFMYFWHVKLHMVSTIALVISIGFAVDYSAHMCHCFTHCLGKTRNQRYMKAVTPQDISEGLFMRSEREMKAIEALVLMGNPLFHGASSTLLGILLLGFSESFVFTVFFRMMVMVVLFGAAHGMVLLPVILSWLGPMTNAHSDGEIEDGRSGVEENGDSKSTQQDMGTATAAGPAEEGTLQDTTRVSVPPPSLSLKPSNCKLAGRGPSSTNPSTRSNSNAPLSSVLTIPSHQLSYNSSAARDRESLNITGSPMRRSKSAAASSRSGLGDLQQQKHDLYRHASLVTRNELLSASRSREGPQAQAPGDAHRKICAGQAAATAPTEAPKEYSVRATAAAQPLLGFA
ncbi:Patched family domain containing protein, putative [Eimeria praecox]|uniref:Patched family domain containing protein, putative n=1 Tax=Eimeria praecox TaxID=51316 RepID=U6GLQ2_9EIME|nr:Patched family domain containing protein, putative [Eimeria praecox]